MVQSSGDDYFHIFMKAYNRFVWETDQSVIRYAMIILPCWFWLQNTWNPMTFGVLDIKPAKTHLDMAILSM